MGSRRLIVLTLEISVPEPRQAIQISDAELAAKVWKAVEEERNTLAMEAKIAAIKILEGNDPTEL